MVCCAELGHPEIQKSLDWISIMAAASVLLLVAALAVPALADFPDCVNGPVRFVGVFGLDIRADGCS